MISSNELTNNNAANEKDRIEVPGHFALAG